MLIVMDSAASPEDVRRVVETVEGLGLQAHAIPGAQRTAIGITGNRGTVEPGAFENLPGVAEVIPVSAPYKLVSREAKRESTVVSVGGVPVGGPEVVVVAGPCAVESEAQAMEIGHAVRKAGATLYRGGAFKPRTSPYSFQGLGEEGLKILARVREETGLPIEHMRRFEGAVVDERAFVAGQARGTRIGREPSAPSLGDLVTDRLGARGVDLETLAWDTYRHGNEPWTVVARFRVGDEAREAQWSFDPQRQTLHALEDEARWLSETEIVDEPIPRRHLAAVRDMVYDVEADGAIRPVLAAVDVAGSKPPEAAEPGKPNDATATLLADLHQKRGVRQQLVELDDDDDDFEGFGPQQLFDIEASGHPSFGDPPAAHPAHSRPEEAVDATVLPLRSPIPGAEPAAEAEPAARVTHRTSRKQRASVPSWDEIVFGAKPE